MTGEYTYILAAKRRMCWSGPWAWWLQTDIIYSIRYKIIYYYYYYATLPDSRWLQVSNHFTHKYVIIILSLQYYLSDTKRCDAVLQRHERSNRPCALTTRFLVDIARRQRKRIARGTASYANRVPPKPHDAVKIF